MIFYLTFRTKQLFQGTYLLHTGKIYWFQSGFQQYTFSVSSIFFEIYTKLIYNNSSFGSLGQNLIIVPISKYEEKNLPSSTACQKCIQIADSEIKSS